jgi:hypothetical protein
MLPATLRARFPQFTHNARNLQLRCASIDSTARQPATQDDKRHVTFNSTNQSEDKQGALDPVVQAQLKRMLRVDHAGEFAAGECSIRLILHY